MNKNNIIKNVYIFKLFINFNNFINKIIFNVNHIKNIKSISLTRFKFYFK